MKSDEAGEFAKKFEMMFNMTLEWVLPAVQMDNAVVKTMLDCLGALAPWTLVPAETRAKVKYQVLLCEFEEKLSNFESLGPDAEQRLQHEKAWDELGQIFRDLEACKAADAPWATKKQASLTANGDKIHAESSKILYDRALETVKAKASAAQKSKASAAQKWAGGMENVTWDEGLSSNAAYDAKAKLTLLTFGQRAVEGGGDSENRVAAGGLLTEQTVAAQDETCLLVNHAKTSGPLPPPPKKGVKIVEFGFLTTVFLRLCSIVHEFVNSSRLSMKIR